MSAANNILFSKIHLKNIKGFADFTLPFDSRLTVLIGKNGTGKTTLLEVISTVIKDTLNFSWMTKDLQKGKNVSLSFHLPRLLSILENKHFRRIEQDKNKLYNGLIDLDFTHVGKWSVELKNEWDGFHKPPKNLTPYFIQPFLDNTYPSYFLYYCTPVHSIQSTIDLKEKEILMTNMTSLDEKFFQYSNGLSRNIINFAPFFKWFEWQERIFLQDKKNPLLEQIRTAIYEVLGDDNNKFSNLHIDWHHSQSGHLSIQKNNIVLEVDQLSSGEQFLMALVAELAKGLVECNLNVEEPLKNGKGLILIDEIDQHLHPAWQRKILPKLLDIFPSCQFIISTHSPQVVSEVQPESIVILKQGENGIEYAKPNASYGKNADRVLEDIMDVDARPSEIKQALQHVFELIQQKQLTQVSEKIQQLQQQIGDDVELAKAEALMQRMELR